ncbi:bifunctional homocysteine S-methyltransferase/methylenetetrahydrofolate reductase [soil metagenome]
MTHPFLQALKERPLLVDGATGTLLYSRGASTEASFEHLNLTRQDLVQQAHIDYINAGADVIETNSFSGNRLRLANFGLEEQVWKLNVWSAKVARNAREVAGQPVFVAGSVGPTGKLLSPLGDTSEEEIANAYQEQMEALLAGGVDLFMIETMSSLEETAIAVKMARKVSQLPVVAQLSFSVEGHTFLGVTPEDAVRLLLELGDDLPDVLGINCGAGPGPVFDSLIRLSAAVRAKGYGEDQISFSCLPNAGQPSLSGGRYTFMSRPSYCASYVEPMVRSGARLIGGCCGTTPEHIKAMRESLDRYIESSKQARSSTLTDLPAIEVPPAVSIIAKPSKKDSAKSAGAKDGKDERSKGNLPDLASRLKEAKDSNNGDFYISVELDPPKGAVTKKLLQAAQLIYEAGADAINVGDSPMARVRMSSLATCQLIGQKVGIDTIIHFTTRDRNLMGIQADLLGCQALGIKNVIALTGDPPALGNYVHATAVYDVDSVGLIKIISQLNQGQDIAGNSIGSPTTLSIACALNPTHENRQQELERLKKKIDAGAHFIMTQPIYQVTDLTDFLDHFGPLPIPILVGIMPLHSFKHAEYLHNEVPGISIPQEIRDAMEKAGEEGSQVGLELAEVLLDEVKSLCQGTYLVPSFGRYEEMATLVRRLKAKSKFKSAAPA